MRFIRFIQEIYNIKFVFSLKILNKTKCNENHLEIYNTDQKNVVVEPVENNGSIYRYSELIQHLRPVDLLNVEDSSSTEIPDAEELNTELNIENKIDLVKKLTKDSSSAEKPDAEELNTELNIGNEIELVKK
ncbi:hypothetical protein JTB14_011211 [Gonioctena quinquepunctata]|nr:hypothetical protein JTB14_011211 [Gonioctena quinquepunctata]